MKKLAFLLLLGIGTSSFAQTPLASNTEIKELGKLQFESELIDYGDIQQNADGLRYFVFKNVGKKPVSISKVKTSCGCTLATKPNKPIMPGENAKIGITYDTKRLGRFSKTIRVSSNAKKALVSLRIAGNVKKNEL